MIPKPLDIKTAKIKLKTKSEVDEAEYICELSEENWMEAMGAPRPKMFAYITRDHVFVIPMIKRVLEDLIGRCEDRIDIADHNIGFLNTSFAADNDKRGQMVINHETDEYKLQKKSCQTLKRAIIAIAKRR